MFTNTHTNKEIKAWWGLITFFGHPVSCTNCQKYNNLGNAVIFPGPRKSWSRFIAVSIPVLPHINKLSQVSLFFSWCRSSAEFPESTSSPIVGIWPFHQGQRIKNENNEKYQAQKHQLQHSQSHSRGSSVRFLIGRPLVHSLFIADCSCNGKRVYFQYSDPAGNSSSSKSVRMFMKSARYMDFSLEYDLTF